MQFITISRGLVEELAGDGDFFHPPFPDYYAMNHMFARAHSIVAEPRPLVVIGISAQSYGFYCSNNREAEGRAFLEGARAVGREAGPAAPAPGHEHEQRMAANVRGTVPQLGFPADLEPNYRRYRMLQILHVYEGHHLRGADQRAISWPSSSGA